MTLIKCYNAMSFHRFLFGKDLPATTNHALMYTIVVGVQSLLASNSLSRIPQVSKDSHKRS